MSVTTGLFVLYAGMVYSVDCGFKMVQVPVLHPHLIKSLRMVDKPSKSIYIIIKKAW